MADSKGIQKTTATVKVDGEDIEIAPGSVQSVTTGATHPADKTPAPVELPDEINRPPVSTNDPETPIAHSNLSGEMGPSPATDIHPETHVADNAYVTDADKDNMEKVDVPAPKTAGKDK